MATTSPQALPLRWTTIFLDFPAETFGPGSRFWCAITGSRLSATRGDHGEFATLLPPSGDPWLRVQRLGDGPPRVHLDLHVDLGELSLDDASAVAEGLGADVLNRVDDVVILTSPGGFVFCLVGWDGEHVVPDPLDQGAGANRADQLCLDIPPDAYEPECAFWAALTGRPLRQGSLPAFRSLDRPNEDPVRILLQRREIVADGDQVTGHLDLACADRDALAPRHEQAGATLVSRFAFWTTMRDPAGRPYCLTPRDPRTGRLPAR